MITITSIAKDELKKTLDNRKADIVRVYYGGPG